jgi:hypothetical protein
MNIPQIPYIEQPNVYNYETWCKIYQTELYTLYTQILNYCQNNCQNIFDNLPYDEFIYYIYINSSTQYKSKLI